MHSNYCAHYRRTHQLCRRHCLHCLLLRLKLRGDSDETARSTVALLASLPRTAPRWTRGAASASRAGTAPAS